MPTTTATTTNGLADMVRARGVLVSLEITTWSARRLDKRVTVDTAIREGASADAGRYNKHLLGGPVPSHSAVTAAATAARTAYYAQTLPWADSGSRLLPTANYFEFAQLIRAERERFRAAVDAFLAEYPRLQSDAEYRLGAMYSADDYPHVDDVAAKFRFRVTFSPVPSGSDIRLDLPPEVTTHIERSVTARVEAATQAAIRDGWERLAESVARVRDRLSEIAAADAAGGKAGRLHATIFESAADTARTLQRLNISDDPELTAIADRIISDLGQLDPRAVRQDAGAMSSVAQQADAILADMRATYGGAP